MKRLRPAIHGHDYESSGEMVSFPDGEHDVCRWCRWPFDEHPNHPTRCDNPRIVAVLLHSKREAVWGPRE